jgi:hypothetical protein
MWNRVQMESAITAIKAALANEALERKAENARELGLDYYVPCCKDKTCPKCKAALEAKDEPMAWLTDTGSVWKSWGKDTDVPLYTTPPQRKPLTDEEIWACLPKDPDEMAFARAIEAAHGIKGEA